MVFWPQVVGLLVELGRFKVETHLFFGGEKCHVFFEIFAERHCKVSINFQR